jgi:hypothetical protein
MKASFNEDRQSRQILNEGISQLVEVFIVTNLIIGIEKSVSQSFQRIRNSKVQYLEGTLFKSIKMIRIRLYGASSADASEDATIAT